MKIFLYWDESHGLEMLFKSKDWETAKLDVINCLKKEEFALSALKAFKKAHKRLLKGITKEEYKRMYNNYQNFKNESRTRT